MELEQVVMVILILVIVYMLLQMSQNNSNNQHNLIMLYYYELLILDITLDKDQCGADQDQEDAAAVGEEEVEDSSFNF